MTIGHDSRPDLSDRPDSDTLAWAPQRETKPVMFSFATFWRVTVTPPKHVLYHGKPLPTQGVTLTQTQYENYLRWRRGKGTLQELLPELDDDEREILRSGIGPAEWKGMFGSKR
jgi:hypothetical protein